MAWKAWICGVLVGAGNLCGVVPAWGQAYCALRDPVTMIYEAYPSADSYRSITKTVGVDDRRAIGEKLPFTIHFDELGRHTLYVALEDGKPIGLVHVRSERGRYGLTEIAWSLGLDMTIQDVRIQRTRDAEMRRTLDGSLRERLRGHTIESLQDQLPAAESVEHADVIRRSAAKTLVVTDHVWRDDLRPYQAIVMAESQWPDMRLDLQPMEVDQGAITEDSGLQKPIIAWRVRSADENDLGVLAWSAWSLDERSADIWWFFKEDGSLQHVDLRRVRGDDVRSAFNQNHAGQKSSDACATAVGVATNEMSNAVAPRLGY
ncbi:MAG: hypothetical protein MK077_04575 [Phycisphaerales bacterium]|nr:hypothetical protein [Phycisphaerales bacterium]